VAKIGRITAMEKEQYQDFLCRIAKQVDSLLIEDTSAIGRFRQHLQSFADEENKHIDWMKKEKEKCFNKEMAFEVSSNMEVPLEYKSPGSILIINPSTKNLPEPKNKEEEYRRYYIILASIHDNILPEVERIDNGILQEQISYLIWNTLNEFYDSQQRRVLIEQALERVKDEKSAETKQNRKTTIVAIIISFIVDLVFELLVYFIPITWFKNHPNSYGLQGSIIFLIPCLILGLFKPQYRKWCWGVGAIAFIVLLLSLMGGPADSNVN